MELGCEPFDSGDEKPLDDSTSTLVACVVWLGILGYLFVKFVIHLIKTIF